MNPAEVMVTQTEETMRGTIRVTEKETNIMKKG